MTFEDATVVQLADEGTRAALFDQDALEQLLTCAYDPDTMGPFQGTYEPLFEDFQIGFAAPSLAFVDGSWSAAGGAERTEARLQVAGLATSAPRVDALWRGAILARFADSGEPITDADVAWSVDGPAVAAGATATAAVSLTMDAPAPVSATRRPMPVTVALLVRDAPLNVASLLHESTAVRERLAGAGVERPYANGARPRAPIVVAWVVPETVFSDSDWPGADDDERRARAGDWMARQGIGLVPVP